MAAAAEVFRFGIRTAVRRWAQATRWRRAGRTWNGN